MESTDSEKSLVQEQVKPKGHWNPSPKGRVRSALWRYREDGTYNNNPISESYYRDYYHEKLSMKKECEFCKSSVCMQQIKRHQKSAKCLKFQNKNI